MSNLLVAWELGGGLGHAGRLVPLARALQQRGHTPTLCLRDLVQTAPLTRGLPTLQAPVWLHRAMGVPEPAASLAEILLAWGYLQADALDALVRGWLATLHASGAQAMVADYAPTALLAARIAGLPALNVAMSFVLPPDAAPMPPYRDWEPQPTGRIARSEAQVLANVNEVLRRHGRAPLERLAQLLRADDAVLCAWPEMDAYERAGADAAAYLGPNFSAGGGEAPQWPDGDGPRVFAYLKSGHPDHAAVLKALDARGCRVLCYLPEVCAGMPVPLRSPRVRFASGPVDLRAALAEADLLVNHAGEGTIAQGLLAGVPQLLLPMQSEQFLMARQVERRTGAAINAAALRRPLDYGAVVRRLLDEPAWRANARAASERHRGFSPEAQVAALVERAERLLPLSACGGGGAA